MSAGFAASGRKTRASSAKRCENANGTKPAGMQHENDAGLRNTGLECRSARNWTTRSSYRMGSRQVGRRRQAPVTVAARDERIRRFGGGGVPPTRAEGRIAWVFFGSAASRFAAADGGKVSQVALSQQIRDLEDELGVALFDHGPKAVRLTEAGRVFLVEARAAVQRVDEAIQTVKAVASGQLGEIHVGYAPSLTVEIAARAHSVFFTKRTLEYAFSFYDACLPGKCCAGLPVK